MNQENLGRVVWYGHHREKCPDEVVTESEDCRANSDGALDMIRDLCQASILQVKLTSAIFDLKRSPKLRPVDIIGLCEMEATFDVREVK